MADEEKGFGINLKVDPAQLAEITETLKGVPNGMPRAVGAAINKTLNKLKTASGREVRKIVNLPTSETQARMFVIPASQNNLEGFLKVSRKSVPLSRFDPIQTKEGVKVRVRKTASGRATAELIPHAFIATLSSGHRGVFLRSGAKIVPDKGNYAGRIIRRGPLKGQAIKRQYIQEQFGPTVIGVLKNAPGVLDKLEADAQRDLAEQQLPSQVDRLLNRQKPDESTDS